MNFKVVFAAMVLPLILVVPRIGLTNNGIEVYEFDITLTEEHPYVECLGEGIDHDLTVKIRTHTIEQPNGSVHIVENYFMEGYSFGKDSGLMWYTQNAAGPWVINDFGNGRLVEGWTLEMVWKPLDGGRKFHEKGRFQVVYDANGNPRVEYIPEDYRMLCVGRN